MSLNVVGPASSPFSYTRPVTEPGRFVGRKDEIDEIFSLLLSPDFGSSGIVGERRSGKTSLLNYISHPSTVRQYGLDPQTCLFIYLDLGMFTSGNTPVEFYRYMLRQIGSRVEDDALKERIREAGQQEGLSDFDLDTVLGAANDLGLRIVLLCDEFQNIGNNSNFGLDFLYGLRSVATRHALALITASRSEIVGMTRGDAMRSSPWFNLFTTVHLRPFNQSDIDEMLEVYLKPESTEGHRWTA